MDGKEPLARGATIVIGLVGIAAAMFAISNPEGGIGWPLTILGLGLCVAVASLVLIYQHRLFATTPLSVNDRRSVLILLVAALSVAGLSGAAAAGFTVNRTVVIADPSADPTPSTSPTAPPTTPTTPSSTPSAGGMVKLPVTMTLGDTPAGLPESVTASVNTAAAEGRRYWVLLRVTYRPGDVEYYGQRALKSGPGEAEVVTLQIPSDADPKLSRVAVVWSVPANIDKKLKAQQVESLQDRTPLFKDDCPDCEAAKVLTVTP